MMVSSSELKIEISLVVKVALVALLGVSQTACSRPNYADDPDLEAVRSAFRCEEASSEVQKRACSAVSRFEAAGPVKSYPAQEASLYLGRRDCSDDSVNQSIVFEIYGLRPGTPPGETAPAHRPGGVVVRGMAVFAPTPLRQSIAAKTMAAIQARTPRLELSAEELTDGVLPNDWQAWAARASGFNTPIPTAKSDGRSLLESPGSIPALWDDAETTTAMAFLREIDDELIFIGPPTNEGALGQQACVSHLWKLPAN
jgi:hypothetical protein